MIDIFLVQKLLCLGEIYLLQMHMLLFLCSELVISACELFFSANYYIWTFGFLVNRINIFSCLMFLHHAENNFSTPR